MDSHTLKIVNLHAWFDQNIKKQNKKYRCSFSQKKILRKKTSVVVVNKIKIEKLFSSTSHRFKVFHSLDGVAKLEWSYEPNILKQKQNIQTRAVFQSGCVEMNNQVIL